MKVVINIEECVHSMDNFKSSWDNVQKGNKCCLTRLHHAYFGTTNNAGVIFKAPKYVIIWRDGVRFDHHPRV